MHWTKTLDQRAQLGCMLVPKETGLRLVEKARIIHDLDEDAVWPGRDDGGVYSIR